MVSITAASAGSRRAVEHNRIRTEIEDNRIIEVVGPTINHNMKPSARRRKRGYGEAQPPSAMLAIYGWMRVMRDCGRYTCDTKAMRPVLQGLCMRYKAMWGQEAFMTEQAKLFSRIMLVKIVASCDSYAIPTWSEALHDAWGVQIRYLSSTGERKDVLCRDFAGEDIFPRANISTIDAQYERTTVDVANLRAVANGHLIMQPAPLASAIG